MGIMSIILLLGWTGILVVSYYLAVYLLKKFDFY